MKPTHRRERERERESEREREKEIWEMMKYEVQSKARRTERLEGEPKVLQIFNTISIPIRT